jgi:hypothetical protein
MSSALTFDAAMSRLKAIGQEHVLRFYKELGDAEQRALLAQVAGLDLEALPRLVERYVLHAPKVELPTDLRPAPYFASKGDGWDRAEYKRVGERWRRSPWPAGRDRAWATTGPRGATPPAP